LKLSYNSALPPNLKFLLKIVDFQDDYWRKLK
jgi:hypothetical protein